MKILYQKYNKNISHEPPKSVLCPPPKPLDLGYRFSLSERLRGKQKQTVESDELST